MDKQKRDEILMMCKYSQPYVTATCPRFDVASLIKAYDELEAERDRYQARAEKAEKSLKHAGYRDCGGELWRPPRGKPPNWDLIDHHKSRAEKLQEENNILKSTMRGIEEYDASDKTWQDICDGFRELY